MTLTKSTLHPRGEGLFERAVRLHLAGNRRDAMTAYREVLQSSDAHAPACNNLGTLLAQQGELDEAQRLFSRAIEIQPDYGEAHNNKGLLLAGIGDTDAAAEAFQRAVSINPANGAWQNNLGNTLVEQFRFRDACLAYDRAVGADASNPDYWSNRGLALRGLRESDEAIRSLRRALDLAPSHVNALSNLGVLLKEQRDHEGAIETLTRAIELAPTHVALLTNIASVYERLGDAAKVRDWARRAIEIDPDYPESYNLLANMEMEDGRYDAALDLYARVLTLDAGNRNANWNLALIWLLRGDFENGWKQFEWRKRLQSVVFDHGDYGPSEWSGDALAGRTILLHSEQGIGDAIQFIRYAAELEALGAGRIVVECPYPLVALLTGVEGVDHVVARGMPLPPFDVHANLMSLPALLGTTLASVPARVPYLPVEPRPVAARVKDAPGLKVGICWAGNPGHARDFLRSAPLSRFIELAAIPGVTLFSLQRGEAAEAELRATTPSPVVDLAPQLGDFRDTAAAIAALDLVITVDTSVAHLAGALGRETWVLLPSVPDFRWMLDREDSPWYPTMRLFRQSAARDWNPVFAQVTSALKKFTPESALEPAHPLAARDDIVTVASARQTPDGRPRFDLWVPLAGLATDGWFDAYEAELVGVGHERAIREFVEQFPGEITHFVDVAPGLGLTAVDVSTGTRQVTALTLVEPDAANRERLESIIGTRSRVPVRSTDTFADALAGMPAGAAAVVRLGDTRQAGDLAAAVARSSCAPQAILWPAVRMSAHSAVFERLAADGYTHLALIWEQGEATIVDPTPDADQCVVSLSRPALDRLAAACENATSTPEVTAAHLTNSGDEKPSSWRHWEHGGTQKGVDHDLRGSEVRALDVSIRETSSSPRPLLSREIGIDWELRGDSGWGVYGMNLAMELLRADRPSPELFAVDMSSLAPMPRFALGPAIDRARFRVAEATARPVHFPGLMLRALGNNLAHGPIFDRVTAARNAGVVFLEDTTIDDAGRARAGTLDLIVAGSSWNERVLRAAGISNVTTVLQGIDPSVFHPAPKRGLLGDRFVVFSGGKLEYRKAQDLVIAAFRRFRCTHPDAVLVAAWHNNWPQLIADLDLAGHVRGLPGVVSGRLDLTSWVAANGIPSDAFLDLGHQSNALMGQYLREADVALFPNRCEGGTNLVAMECMACGIPTILSANTGHHDLLASEGCIPLGAQRSVTAPSRFFRGVDGWGESDVDEIVFALENAYTQRASMAEVGRRGALNMSRMTWDLQVTKLLDKLAPLW
jgi:tetratricopeptide (TPR) repeat protein/glycosyltransferase involved in cell wall biosynthesis